MLFSLIHVAHLRHLGATCCDSLNLRVCSSLRVAPCDWTIFRRPLSVAPLIRRLYANRHLTRTMRHWSLKRKLGA